MRDIGVMAGGGGVEGLEGGGETQTGRPRLAHSSQSSGSRENNSSRASSSREYSSYARSRLSIQASSSWAVEGEQGQIVVGCDRERQMKLTLWLRSRGAGNRNGQGADRESPDEEEGESGFEEHDDMECR